jgi:glycosyltransferase involved in cell wall biosynthesis
MITFSVITVTYNAGRLCEQTFRSVSEQTHPYVEHLIMDGASKDNTLELARAYQEENSIGASRHEVKVFSEPDGGLYEAMNKGLRQCTGDYVIFLNAGDVFPSSSTLEFISDAIKGVSDNALPAVLYGDTDVVDENRQVLYRRKGNVPEKLSWRSFLKGMLVCHQAFYVRTDIAKLTPYDLQYRYSADVDWCIRVMKEADRQGLPLLNVHAVIAYFMEGGMTTVHHRDSLKERFRVMVTHYGIVATILSHIWFVIRGIIAKARTL